jgi:HSP20 family molecular chaperone IbpA
MPKRQKWTVAIFFLALGLFMAFTLSSMRGVVSIHQSRQKLNNLLGENPFAPNPPQAQQTPSDTDPNADMDDLSQGIQRELMPLQNFGHPFQATTIPQVSMTETTDAYQVKIPLSQPEDEKNVQVKVDPHNVRLSGQFTLRSPDHKSVIGSTSFMKSFSPAMEVNPNGVRRLLEKNDLLVIIPKRYPGKTPINPIQPGGQSPSTPSQKPLPPDVYDQLKNRPKTII